MKKQTEEVLSSTHGKGRRTRDEGCIGRELEMVEMRIQEGIEGRTKGIG